MKKRIQLEVSDDYIGFTHDGIFIIYPTYDTSMMNKVNPLTEYGITEKVALAIETLNNASQDMEIDLPKH